MALRRWLLGAGVAFTAAPATLCVGVAPARAEQPVVRATVYAAGQGAPRTVTVTDTRLAGCPGYSGSAPFVLEPGGASYQPVSGSDWSLGTIVQCGLQIPLTAAAAVAVQKGDEGFEPALTAPDLELPGRYHDPGARAALPVVSLNGTGGQVTFDRPWRGGADRNGADEVVTTGAPISINVYENSAPLQVRIVATRLGGAAGSVRERFTAHVTNPGGPTVPSSGLSEAWTFGDGTSATTPDPAHSFSGAGRYFVTVTVSDAAAGTGGTRTVVVAVGAKALSGNHHRAGAGNDRTSKSKAGTVHGSGPSPGSPQAARDQTVTNPSATPAPSATPTPAPSPTPPSTSTPPSTATPAPAAAPSPVRPHSRPRRGRAHRPRSPARRRTTRAVTGRRPSTRLVTGQLVAALDPVPVASSPLARPAATVTPSAVVGAATHTTTVAGWAAALVVAALLGIGAAGERRGRGRWGRLHPPSDRR